MKRRLFNLAAAVSLILFIVTTKLWLRSFKAADSLGYDSHWHATSLQKDMAIRGCRGTIAMRINFVPAEGGEFDDKPASFFHESFEADPSDDPLEFTRQAGWVWHGFGYYPIEDPNSVGRTWTETFTRFELCLPFWFAALAFTVIPATWLARRRRGQSEREIRCPTCSYDLRATPDRCPECGTPIPVTIPAAKALS